MRRWQMQYATRQAASVTLAVVVALLASRYVPWQHTWLVASAFLVCQTTCGTPLKQRLVYWLLMLLAVLAASIWMMLSDAWWWVPIALLLLSALIAWRLRWVIAQTFYLVMLFSVALMAMCYLHGTQIESIELRMMSVIIGGGLGVVLGGFFLPSQPYQQFAVGVLPVLHAMRQYAHEMFEVKFNESANEKIRLEQVFQNRLGLYPEWVFELGFNRGLRSGFRFVLVQLDRLGEVFFSMDYWRAREVSSPWYDQLLPYCVVVMQQNEELLVDLIAYFATGEQRVASTDYMEDMIELDNRLKEIVPASIELLDMSEDYLALTAMVSDLKDMRDLLLQLAAALP